MCGRVLTIALDRVVGNPGQHGEPVGLVEAEALHHPRVEVRERDVASAYRCFKGEERKGMDVIGRALTPDCTVLVPQSSVPSLHLHPRTGTTGANKSLLLSIRIQPLANTFGDAGAARGKGQGPNIVRADYNTGARCWVIGQLPAQRCIAAPAHLSTLSIAW